MGGQFSGHHAGSPDHLVLQDVQGVEKAQIGLLDLRLNRSFGHLQANEVKSDQSSPDFLLDSFGLLAMQGEHLA